MNNHQSRAAGIWSSDGTGHRNRDESGSHSPTSSEETITGPSSPYCGPPRPENDGSLQIPTSPSSQAKSPVSVIQEWAQRVSIIALFTEEPPTRGPGHTPSYHFTLKIHGKTFRGEGSTKKEAKNTYVLRCLTIIHFSPFPL
ncbi:hypothetical protein T439DRAFT_37468 [Meredithblackwellia eburnea MCA 4105]